MEDTTLATVVSAAGYRTCLVNKWHLDGYDPQAAPNHRGFHEFYGWTISTVHSNAPYYYPYYRLHGDSLINIAENEHDAHVRHNTEISTDDALQFIHRNKDNPFFLFLGYDAPHEPYNIDDTSWYDEQGNWSDNTKRYAALVTHMDYNIGRLLSALDALNLREKTLVIFASDNGAAVMVYFPDFMPTLAAITTVPIGLPDGSLPPLCPHTDGMDISPLFYGQDIDTDSRQLYWEFPGKQRALRHIS